MKQQVIISGGGIGGLAAALTASRAGWDVSLLEKAAAFSEVGAGIQLGPNVTHILRDWGVLPESSFSPDYLQVCSAASGKAISRLELGNVFERRYGAPYLTIHRADLHAALRCAAEAAGAQLHTGTRVLSVDQRGARVRAITEKFDLEGEALIAADGIWSTVRAQLLQDGPARATGHLAYRSVVRQSDLPERLRSYCVTVWLGVKFHVVSYPVRAGDFLNIVCIVNGRLQGKSQDEVQTWDHLGSVAGLKGALGSISSALDELVSAVPDWSFWVLHDRPSLTDSFEMAAGRVALLGDAAHPMRPYLAQGAAMALEDAAELGKSLIAFGDDAPWALKNYAQNRWQRNARVQARALRNGEIFHADGLLRWGRDAAMKVLGERLLDMPWLYGASSTASSRL